MLDTLEYEAIQRRLAGGWNTFYTRSMLCWVNMPSAIALNVGIMSYASGQHGREILIGREEVTVADHAYDGSYSSLSVEFGKTVLQLHTATMGGDLVILAEAESTAVRAEVLVVEIGLLWNRPGQIFHENGHLHASSGHQDVYCYAAGETIEEPNAIAFTPFVALDLSSPNGLSTGTPRTLEDIRDIIEEKARKHKANREAFGEHAEIYDAIQSCTAWDTIYEPIHSRVVTPVSRCWNSGDRGGYVLFCWDTFFAASLASVDNPDLAHANAVEILRECVPQGFVPNVSQATGRKSIDRSQPPVGAITILEIYRKFRQRWFLAQTFDALLKWNRWWLENRAKNGYLCWGSDPFDPVIGDQREHNQNNRACAALESGLDNSPMYDGIPFDTGTHLMLLADVGLMGLFIADCKALGEIARLLGRIEEMEELNDRSESMSKSLQTLWSEEDGVFLNKRLDNNEFQRRLSPTHFYPLLAGVATDEQARRMIDEHFFNPEEFWGDWILPSIARNDPAYEDQDYWRGRIWAPMNWLVYLGLCKYENLADARKALVEKSANLLLKEWRTHRHIHENYNADNGAGCDVANSDRFYHWGALLGLIAVEEARNGGGV